MPIQSKNGTHEPSGLLDPDEGTRYLRNIVLLADEISSGVCDLLQKVQSERYEEAATLRDELKTSCGLLANQLQWILKYCRFFYDFIMSTQAYDYYEKQMKTAQGLSVGEIIFADNGDGTSHIAKKIRQLREAFIRFSQARSD